MKTKKSRKQKLLTKAIIYNILNYGFLIGPVIALVIITLSTSQGGNPEIAKIFEDIIYPMCAGIITLLVMLIIFGHKFRASIWMISLILAAYLYDTLGMWIIFGIWFIDEYPI